MLLNKSCYENVIVHSSWCPEIPDRYIYIKFANTTDRKYKSFVVRSMCSEPRHGGKTQRQLLVTV